MRFTDRLQTRASSSYNLDSSSTSILPCNTSNCFVEFVNGLAESREGYGNCGVDDVAMDDYCQTIPNQVQLKFDFNVPIEHIWETSKLVVSSSIALGLIFLCKGDAAPCKCLQYYLLGVIIRISRL